MVEREIQRKLDTLLNKINILEDKQIPDGIDINKIKVKNNITKLNKRKTFYLKQQTQNTEDYIVILFTIYYILLSGLVIIYIQKKLYTSMKSIVIFIALALLPITINKIIEFIISLLRKTQDMIPVNKYRGLYKQHLKQYLDLAAFDLEDIK